MNNKNKYIEVKINKEIYQILKVWNKQRKEELNTKNFGTREPIYKVQSKTYVPSDDRFGYDKVELVINIGGDYESFENLEKIKEHYTEEYFENTKKYNDFIEMIDNCYDIFEVPEKFEELKLDYGSYEECEFKYDDIFLFYSNIVWIDKAFFLTYKEAEEYMQYQKHNLGYCRIYVDYPGYANKSTLNKFLEILDNKDIFEVE